MGGTLKRDPWRFAFFGVVLAALAVRLVLASLQSAFVFWPDGAHYLSLASNLADGAGYLTEAPTNSRTGLDPDAGPTSFWLPGYPLLLAGVFSAFGPSPRAVFVLQALLGTGTVLGTGLLGRRLGGWPLATGAAAIVAVSPLQLVQVDRVATETLATLLFVLLVGGVFRGSGRAGTPPSALGAAALGAVIGLGVLTRSAFVVAGGVALVLTWLGVRRSRSTRAAFTSVAIAGGVASLVVLPWLLRNAMLWGELVYQTKSGGNLLVGFNDFADGSYATRLPPLPPGLDELARHERSVALARDWVLAHPVASAGLALKRLVLFWSPVHDRIVTTSAAGVIVLAWSTALLTLAFGQLVQLVRQPAWDWAVPTLLALGYGAPHALAFYTTRFRVPVEPALALLAAGGLVLLARRLRVDGRGP